MRTLKFRIPHYNFNGTFSHFSYWGTIDNKGEFSDGGMFTSPATSSGTKKGWHEQFTGLKDKNGKEIYENDIVSYYQPYADRTDIHTVKWDEKFAAFGLFKVGNEWCQESDWMKIQEIEVLGNIHS